MDLERELGVWTIHRDLAAPVLTFLPEDRELVFPAAAAGLTLLAEITTRPLERFLFLVGSGRTASSTAHSPKCQGNWRKKQTDNQAKSDFFLCHADSIVPTAQKRKERCFFRQKGKNLSRGRPLLGRSPYSNFFPLHEKYAVPFGTTNHVSQKIGRLARGTTRR